MDKETPQKRIRRDWHRWDIKAALGKKGYSFARVARENGYKRTSPGDVLRKPWPAMERIFANIIDEEPWNIWPSRYDDNNKPLYGDHRSIVMR
jgi:Ner family transcriptional regulator